MLFSITIYHPCSFESSITYIPSSPCNCTLCIVLLLVVLLLRQFTTARASCSRCRYTWTLSPLEPYWIAPYLSHITAMLCSLRCVESRFLTRSGRAIIIIIIPCCLLAASKSRAMRGGRLLDRRGGYQPTTFGDDGTTHVHSINPV